jgi:tRNA threonylcarbamoyladenosine biosynthesis protein TsaE
METIVDHTTHTPEETKAFAAEVVAQLAEKEKNRGTGTIVALQGDLGAGKTAFAQGVAEALGVEGPVTSPTFVLQKVYPLPDGAPWKRLVHIDAYRMAGEEELETIDWHTTTTDPSTLILIEWPEQVGVGVPERAAWVTFDEVDEHTRTLHVKF